MSHEVRHETETSASWIEAVRGWPWHRWEHNTRFLGWMKYGACPRCGHSMSVYQPVLYAAFTEGDDVTTLLAACNCEHDHPGRPKSISVGCGQHGVVTAKQVDQ